MKLIAAVAEAGSIAKAGESLHLTQSALSHTLRDAEAKLGTSLFHRLNKKMILTQAGERLLASARAVLDELKRAEEDIRQIALAREGVLRICTECYTCYHWLPHMLTAFNEKYPRVELRIVPEATGNPIQALLDGKLDLAIVSDPVRNHKVMLKYLFTDEMVAVMSPQHPLAARPFLRAEDFAGENLFVYCSLQDTLIFQKVLLPARITPKRVTQVQLSEAIIELVKAGLGLSVMARWAVLPQLAANILRAVPVTSRGLRRRWSAAMVKNRLAPSYLSDFVSMLARESIPGALEPQPRKLHAANIRLVKAQ